MAGDELILTPNPAAFADGVDCHGTIVLPIITQDQTHPFSRTLKLLHQGKPPQVNLALEADPAPSWITGLSISPLSRITPPVPGPLGVGPTPLPAALKPGIPPVGAAAGAGEFFPPLIDVLPFPAAPPMLATSSVAASPPGTIMHFSAPGTTYLIQVSGLVPPGQAVGIHKYFFYVSGEMYLGPLVPPGPRSRLGRVSIVICIRGEGKTIV